MSKIDWLHHDSQTAESSSWTETRYVETGPPKPLNLVFCKDCKYRSISVQYDGTVDVCARETTYFKPFWFEIDVEKDFCSKGEKR